MYNKANYICQTPFTYTEVFDDQQFLCCGNWLYKDKDIKVTDNIKDNFYSDKAEYIRSTILDGSYSLCSETTCPKLVGLKNGVVDPSFIPNTEENRKKVTENTKINMVNFCFDRSCNLACPSCRIDFINVHGKERLAVEEKMRQVEEELYEDVEALYLSGTADPFFSNSYRKFLTNLDPDKYSKLNHIHLHTNANLWTKQFWLKLHKVHHLVKSCEISIDAATKKTYDIVRRGGDWDKLIENLKFIVTIPSIQTFNFSMVVSDDNYKEMLLFHQLLESIFTTYAPKANWHIFYNRLTDWGTFSAETLASKQVFNKDNPLFEDFCTELEKIKHITNKTTNFPEISSNKTLI